ncbi:MAG: signal transduction histidine kinase [Bacteroidetes bacterium]|nr:signal transduction histidine kinase [Bacteroidota bacterium]
MLIKDRYEAFMNLGVKPTYQLWERHLTRKINSISIIGIVNIVCGILFFTLFKYNEYVLICTAGVIVLIAVIALNYYKNYIWAVYLFFIYGFFGFFVPMIVKGGVESYIGLFYFPVIISMIMLLGRKETLKHFITLSFFCFLSITLIGFGYKLNYIVPVIPYEQLINMRVFNMVFCIILTLSFTATIVSENVKQEEVIKKMLVEKEILLAEVFHRVKNNMNIVTSLLNLKKNMSDSEEVKVALEDCRNRVFSMALVHQNIFSKGNTGELNFKTYIEQLITEMGKSFGKEKEFKIHLDVDEVHLEVATAIPSGLILNELITNSFKYAQPENGHLQIHISLKNDERNIQLKVKDNGPGFFPSDKTANSLGMELIKDLSEQLNGVYSFNNNSGLEFNLKFKSLAN